MTLARWEHEYVLLYHKVGFIPAQRSRSPSMVKPGWAPPRLSEWVLATDRGGVKGDPREESTKVYKVTKFKERERDGSSPGEQQSPQRAPSHHHVDTHPRLQEAECVLLYKHSETRQPGDLAP